MTQNDPRADVARRPLVLHVAGMDEASVRANQPYREGDDGMFDLYRGGAAPGEALQPAVIVVMGVPDAGMRRFVGCSAKEMESYVTWARYLAASGFVAITYTNADPVQDAERVLQYVRDHAAALGVDRDRLAIWSCSGNVPTALGLLMNHADLAAAVLAYGYTIDVDGSTAVAEAKAQFRFADPVAGRSPADLPPHVPLCLVRAGQDALPRLNESLDRFSAHLLKANRPLTLINAPELPHAFDSASDTGSSRAVIRQMQAFLQSHTRARENGERRTKDE
jgi:hypothetical protein